MIDLSYVLYTKYSGVCSVNSTSTVRGLPANIEIKGYLLSMLNFEIFKGGPEKEGKVSTKKPKAGYSPASTALLLATAVLTSAGRAIIMISNAAFPVFRIMRWSTEYSVLTVYGVWSTTMKCRYPEILFDEQEITFEDQLSSSTTSWYSVHITPYNYGVCTT